MPVGEQKGEERMTKEQRSMLKSRLKAKGCTYDLLAMKTGIPRTSLFALLNGKREFRAWQIEAIKKYLNLSYANTYKIFIANAKPTTKD